MSPVRKSVAVLAAATLAVLAPVGLASASTVHHPTVGIRVSHTTIHRGASVTFSGAVSPNQHGHYVHLQRYYSGAWHQRATVRLSSTSRYSVTITPGRTGHFAFRVYDYAETGWTSGHSSPVHVRVTAPAPPPAQQCYPLTNGGNCYEPGEFCRDSDHGMTGIAGDGEAIICEDNNGWRWEPR